MASSHHEERDDDSGRAHWYFPEKVCEKLSPPVTPATAPFPSSSLIADSPRPATPTSAIRTLERRCPCCAPPCFSPALPCPPSRKRPVHCSTAIFRATRNEESRSRKFVPSASDWSDSACASSCLGPRRSSV